MKVSEIRSKLDEISSRIQESYWITDLFAERFSGEDDSNMYISYGISDLLEQARQLITSLDESMGETEA